MAQKGLIPNTLIAGYGGAIRANPPQSRESEPSTDFKHGSLERFYSVSPGYSGLAASSSPAAECTRSAVPSVSVYLAFDVP